MGTIVNELGALKGNDKTCDDATIAALIKAIFDYLSSDEGKGVVTEMIWFNQDQVGGTFDLRLIRDNQITPMGQQYLDSCKSWVAKQTPTLKE